MAVQGGIREAIKQSKIADEQFACFQWRPLHGYSLGMPEPMSPVEEARAALKVHGIALTVAPGEYVINWRNGQAATEYRTGDLAEAVEHGLAMERLSQELPPLGPMGTGNASRRARMYAHNRKLAARRGSKK